MSQSTAEKLNQFGLRIARKAARRMPDRCFVQPSPGDTSDKRGFAATAFADVGDELPCRMDGQFGYRELAFEGQTTSAKLYRVTMPAMREDGTPISIAAKDRLRIVARGARGEQLLDIQDVAEREGVMIHVFGIKVTS